MTDDTSRPMVFGDIHDLLRKVNGESEPAYMWQSDKQGKEIRTEEPPPVKEEQVKEPAEKLDEETNPIAKTEDEPMAKKKVPSHKEKAKPLPSKTIREIGENAAKKPKGDKQPSAKNPSPSKDDIQSQIESFSYAGETGRRYWIFVPDDVHATFEVVYGGHRLSAIFTALARSFIDANKEELRRLVTHRSGLFE